MHTILRLIATAAAVYLTINLVPGIGVSGGWLTLALVTVVWSALNIAVKPVLAILTLPLTIITFGLFALVLNAFLFWLVSVIVPGFVVAGFIPALLGALVLSVLSWLIHHLL
jgi:putative membrane protein